MTSASSSASASSSKKSTTNSNKSRNSRIFTALGVAAVVCGVAYATNGTLHSVLGAPAHANKPYRSFAKFFPFYVTEHSDPTCRLLHVIGTTISSLFFLTNPTLLISALTAISVAFMACELFISLPNGAVEAAFMIATYLALNYYQSRRFGWEPVLIGYAFAWVGHFFFQLNKPATFIYTGYSLAGDYRMLFDIAVGKLSIN